MNLKQSDKMIAIIGVVILIIVAISIVYYVSTEEEVGEPTKEKKTFKVAWNEKNGEMKITDINIGKESYTTPFTVLTESGSVLETVDVQIVWKDDNTYGILREYGQDKLTATISLAGGETKTHEATGEGDETLSFKMNTVSYRDDVIEADDIDEAKKEIKDKYQGFNSALFDVDVSVETGERFKFIRPLRSFLNNRKDKGETFSFFITYTYSYPEIIEDQGNNYDGDNTTGQGESKGKATYKNMGLPGKN